VKIGDTQLPKDTPGWSLGNLNPYILKNFYETDEIKNYMENQGMTDIYDNNLKIIQKNTFDTRKYLSEFFNELPSDVAAKAIKESRLTMNYRIIKDTPEEYYQEIVREARSKEYHISLSRGTEKNIVFDIPGNEISSGTTLYILYTNDHNYIISHITKTREDIVEKFLELRYQYFVDAIHDDFLTDETFF